MSYYVYVHHIFVLNWLHQKILSTFSVWTVWCLKIWDSFDRMSAVQVEAYGSEKGELSVDDITNVLKTHGTERVGRNKGLQNDVPQKEGYGWFPLFAGMTFACVGRYCVHWFGGTHSSRDSSAVHCMLTTISSDLKAVWYWIRTWCTNYICCLVRKNGLWSIQAIQAVGFL